MAPLAILTAAVAARHYSLLPRLSTAMLMLAAFSGIVLRIGSVYSVGFTPAWWDNAHRLAIPRGGLQVTAIDSVRYTRVMELVARHRGSGTVLAGPGLPEVYYFANVKSPGLDSYGLFRREFTDSTQLTAVVGPTTANVVVINFLPEFGTPLRADVYRWISLRYPLGERVDPITEVRWRAAQ